MPTRKRRTAAVTLAAVTAPCALYLLATLGLDLTTMWTDGAADERYGRTLWLCGIALWCTIAYAGTYCIAVLVHALRTRTHTTADGDDE